MGDAEVNEESLTRCIYAHDAFCRKIKSTFTENTVPGQGFHRFNRPKSVGAPLSAPQPTLIYIGDTSFSDAGSWFNPRVCITYREGIIAVCALWPERALPVTAMKNCRSVKDILEPAKINYAPIISPGR